MTPELATRTGHLQSLARALEGSGDAEVWSGVDLHRALTLPVAPPDPTEDEEPRSVRWVEAVRNVLVFAPLAVTWVGLWQATSAYTDLIASGSQDSSLSFFRLWQTDFQGRLAFGFHDMAVTTLGVLTLLAVTTLLGAHLQRSSEPLSSARDDALRERLFVALTDASLHLARVRAASPERLSREFTVAAGSFRQLVGHVEAGGRAVEEALAGLREVVVDLGRTAGTIERSNTATTAAVASLESSATRLQPALEGALRHFEQEARTAAIGLSDCVREAELGHEALVRELVAVTEGATQSLQGQVEASTSWTVGAATALVEAVGELRTRLEAVGDHLAVVVTDHADRVGELEGQATDNARRLLDAVARLGDDLQGLATGLPDVARGVDRLRVVVPDLDRTLDKLVATAPAVEKRLDDLITSAPGLTARFDGLLTALPALTQHLAGVDAAAPRLATDLTSLVSAAPALAQQLAALVDSGPALVQPVSELAARLPLLVQSTDQLQDVSTAVTQGCTDLRAALDAHAERIAQLPTDRPAVLAPVELPEAS